MELTYSMATTISISEDMKEKLRNIGRTGDSYEDVIRKMYEITRKNILLAYLYDTSDSISIDEAIAQAKTKWQK
jgi:predicted CopG family antitoxin